MKRRCGREPKCRWGLIGNDDQASATTASKCDDSEQMRRRRAKATAVSKSDDEQAKVTSTANDLAARANDSARSSRMGSAKGIVANGFGVWMLRMGSTLGSLRMASLI